MFAQEGHIRILTESGVKRIFEPLQVVSLRVVHQHDIETAWRDALEAGKILLRSTDDALLFAAVDAGCRSAEIRVAPQAHLDEYQRCAILHDQIDLAEATAIILRDRFQALLLQMLGGPLFSLRASHGLLPVIGCY